MEMETTVKIIGVVLAIVTAFFGSVWVIGKAKIKGVADLLQEIDKGLEDDNLTQDEIARIVKKAKAILGR